VMGCLAWSILSVIFVIATSIGGVAMLLPSLANMFIAAAVINMIRRAAREMRETHLASASSLFTDFWVERKEWPGFFIIVWVGEVFDPEEDLKEFNKQAIAFRGPNEFNLRDFKFGQTYFILFKDPDDAMMFKLRHG